MFLVVPLDASIGKVLYISWGSHNHPPPSPTKMSAVARAALRSVLRQSGGVGAGLGQLQAHVLRYGAPFRCPTSLLCALTLDATYVAPLVLDPVFGIGSGSTSSGIMDLHPTLGTSEMLARTIRKERQRAVVTEDMTLDGAAAPLGSGGRGLTRARRAPGVLPATRALASGQGALHPARRSMVRARAVAPALPLCARASLPDEPSDARQVAGGRHDVQDPARQPGPLVSHQHLGRPAGDACV
jgi:hypothetical protein